MNYKKKILFPFDFDEKNLKMLHGQWWHRLVLVLYYLIAIFVLIIPLIITISWNCDSWNQGTDFIILTNIIILSFWLVVCYLLLLLIQILYFYFLDLIFYITKGEKHIFHQIESNNSEKFLKIFLKLFLVLLIINGLSLFIIILLNGIGIDLNNYPQIKIK